MSDVTASLQIQFVPRETLLPFEIVADLNTPAVVSFGPGHYAKVDIRNIQPWVLGTEGLGEQRVRVYCSASEAATVRLYAEGPDKTEMWRPLGRKVMARTRFPVAYSLASAWIGSFTPEYVATTIEDVECTIGPTNILTSMGRRSAPLIESLSWAGDYAQSLKYPYDSPEVAIKYQTDWRDRYGNLVAGPIYNPSRGEFRAASPLYGGMIIQYHPFYTLYSLQYDTGRSAVATEAHWRELQTKWVFDAVSGNDLAKLRIFVVSAHHTVVGEFDRTLAVAGWRDLQEVYETAGVAPWQRVFTAGIMAIQKTATEKIVNASNPDDYINVERDVEITLQETDTGIARRYRILRNAK